MIKPTVGRIVWFHSYANGKEYPEAAALVVHVLSDDLVNLAVFGQSGELFPRTSVPLYQGEGARPVCDFCEWMPYQIGQAAKELAQRTYEECSGPSPGSRAVR